MGELAAAKKARGGSQPSPGARLQSPDRGSGDGSFLLSVAEKQHASFVSTVSGREREAAALVATRCACQCTVRKSRAFGTQVLEACVVTMHHQPALYTAPHALSCARASARCALAGASATSSWR